MPKLTALLPNVESLSFKSNNEVCVEPLESILNLKNLTYLVSRPAARFFNFFNDQITRQNLTGNKSKLDVNLNGPLKLKHFIMNESPRGSPKMIATIVRNCPDLELLSAKNSIFDDECCQALENCPNLEVLRVKATRITAAGKTEPIIA